MMKTNKTQKIKKRNLHSTSRDMTMRHHCDTKSVLDEDIFWSSIYWDKKIIREAIHGIFRLGLVYEYIKIAGKSLCIIQQSWNTPNVSKNSFGSEVSWLISFQKNVESIVSATLANNTQW